MTIDFDEFCHQLAIDKGLSTHPAEIHGLGCGVLAAGFRPDADALLQHINAYVGDEMAVNETIIDYFRESLRTLESDEFEFQLCLPDDDLYGLTERAESLSAWCQGFLHGFAAVQNSLSEEARELLRDLTEISQLDAASLESSDSASEEENEGYYTELTEFVRLAVSSLFMDNNPRESDEQENSKHVHH